MLKSFILIFVAVLLNKVVVINAHALLFEEEIDKLPSFKSNLEKEETRYCHRRGSYFREGTWVPAPLGQCAKLYCRCAEKNDIEISGCNELPHLSNCHPTIEDLTRLYPDCCPVNKCEDMCEYPTSLCKQNRV